MRPFRVAKAPSAERERNADRPDYFCWAVASLKLQIRPK